MAKRLLYITVYYLLMAHICSAGDFSASSNNIFRSSITGRDVPEVWRTLAAKLVSDGEDINYVMAIFSSPAVHFRADVMPRKIVHDESKLPYNRFLKPERLKRASAYLKSNRELLNRIEKHYSVPASIIVAIALIETDLGGYLGAGPAFNILASMAAASTMDHVKGLVPTNRMNSLDIEKIANTLKKKSKWAYGELRALIEYASENKMDILSIKGSIFGAIGICQFMPGNIRKLAVDFDNDGRKDLFSASDALASIANYLKHHGWKSGLSEQEKMKVIMRYNHSRPYASTVLKVAERI